MAHDRQTRYSNQYNAAALAAKSARIEPGREHLAVHARQLAFKPDFQIIRRDRRHMLRSLEQAHRETLENNVHRNAGMGVWGLINARRYKVKTSGAVTALT